MKKNLKSIDLNLVSEFILSILVLIMGIVVMIFKTFGLIEVVLYGSVLFYIYALFSTILYFVGRKEGDYELLLLSLISIITATFMYVFKDDNPAMILGAGMTIFTILTVANRGVKVIQFRREDNYMWVIKFFVTFLIGFLGMLTTFNLFNNVTVQTMMFGFYFISLGFILSIENIINIFITNDSFKKMLSKVLEDETSKKLEKVEDLGAKRETENKVIVKNKQETKTTHKKEQTEIKKETKVEDKEKKVKVEKKETKITETPKKVGRPKKEIMNETSQGQKIKQSKTKELKSTNKKVEIKKEEKKSEPKTRKQPTKEVKEEIVTVKKKPGRPKKTEK